MKKLYILAAIFLASCTEDSKNKDRDFYTPILGQISIGTKHSDLVDLLKHYGLELQLYNQCTEVYELKPGDCEKGYSSVVVVALPSDNRWLGKGDLQIYFTFNSKKILAASYSEVYYANQHK